LMTSTKPVILKNAKDEHLFRILDFYVGMGTVENIDTLDAVVTFDTVVTVVDDVYLTCHSEKCEVMSICSES